MSQNTNGFDTDNLTSFLDRVINLKDTANSECSTINAVAKSDIEEVLDEANGQGIPKKILRAQVKKQMLERSARRVGEKFDDDDGALFEQMTEALGEYAATPLGAAAVSAAT